MKTRFAFFFPGVFWLLLCTLLLTLPGSAFPTEDWLDKIWFDKWVHTGLFGILVVCWCRGISQSAPGKKRAIQLFIWITVASICYGTAMEFVQKYFVVNRSFDTGDIIADAAGSLAGYFFSRRIYIKK
ncbi:MAG: VanZ family protein [Sphingobacteriales bacterium]|nr:VanZ family protein [Sphingobacteriales bacterium]